MKAFPRKLRASYVLNASTRSRFSLSPFAIAYLDGARAVAALLVLVGHLNTLFFVATPTSHTLLSKVFYSIAARSHDAVLVFFVLSGLLVGMSAHKAYALGSPGWRHYTASRLSRLLTVLVPALLLGALWDHIGLDRFGPDYGTADIPVQAHETFSDFFGNLFFLQGVIVDPFGSNKPLWSLSYEAWYYFLFPLLLVLAGQKTSPRTRCINAMLFGASLAFVGWKISEYFTIWLMGAALYVAAARYPLKFKPRLVLAVSGILIIVVIFIMRKKLFADDEAGFTPDFVVSGFIMLHFLVATCITQEVSPIMRAVTKFFADFSFTLYVVHFPALLFVSCVIAKEKWAPDILHMLYGIGIISAAIAYAKIVAYVTERHTPKIQRIMEHGLRSTGTALR